jgi:hypothetical protein
MEPRSDSGIRLNVPSGSLTLLLGGHRVLRAVLPRPFLWVFHSGAHENRREYGWSSHEGPSHHLEPLQDGWDCKAEHNTASFRHWLCSSLIVQNRWGLITVSLEAQEL